MIEYPSCTHADCTQPASAIFADVPLGHQAQKEIEGIYEVGVTTGCAANPLRFCPENQVTNAEMAAFLLRAKEGAGYQPPACTAAPFLDVPHDYWACNWIGEESRRQISAGCGGGNFCPETPIIRSGMAGLLTRTFDIPVEIDPNTSRTIQYAYTSGLLTSVKAGSTTYGTLSYHPNLLVSQVAHGNGVTETQGNNPSEMRRPASLSATGPYASWSSGAYAYDGAGNIKTIGTYRDGSLLAAETQTGRRHFHLDHLGTPRLITRASGYKAAYHVYYPFGEELTAFNQDAERMKFTGHERDLGIPVGAGDDLDYMHARHCSPVTGRFLSVDPAGESFDPMVPQSWNRYSYVQNSPLSAIDPTGKILIFTGTSAQFREIERIANSGLHSVRLVIGSSLARWKYFPSN